MALQLPRTSERCTVRVQAGTCRGELLLGAATMPRRQRIARDFGRTLCNHARSSAPGNVRCRTNKFRNDSKNDPSSVVRMQLIRFESPTRGLGTGGPQLGSRQRAVSPLRFRSALASERARDLLHYAQRLCAPTPARDTTLPGARTPATIAIAAPPLRCLTTHAAQPTTLETGRITVLRFARDPAACLRAMNPGRIGTSKHGDHPDPPQREAACRRQLQRKESPRRCPFPGWLVGTQPQRFASSAINAWKYRASPVENNPYQASKTGREYISSASNTERANSSDPVDPAVINPRSRTLGSSR
jgi:hypothetical protein